MKKLIQTALFLVYAIALAVVLPAYAEDSALDAKAYYNRGTEYYGKANYAAAIEDLSKALALEPEAPDAFFNRGLSYRRLNKIPEAISDFSNAIEIYPRNSSYYFERCNAFIVKNDFGRAVTDCSEAIRLSPQANGYFLRGLANMLRGDLDGALADSVRTLQIEPNHPDVRRLLNETLTQRELLMGVR